MKRKLLTLLLITLLLSCEIEKSYPKADWTLMFYLADDYSEIPLTADLREIISQEVNTSNIRLIILYDGTVYGDSKLTILDSPFVLNSREIGLQSTTIKVNNDNELDMADTETLETYIKYVKNKMPSDRYALYFGSHGTGFTTNFNSGLAVEGDTVGGAELLTVDEIATAVKNSDGVNLIAFDACNMGNIETVYEFKDSNVEYVIASPELIPGNGNDYERFITAAYNLSDLSTISLGKSTLEVYYDYYTEHPGINNNHELRSLLQMYDVGKIKSLVESSTFRTDIRGLLDEITGDETYFNYENISNSESKANYINLIDIYEESTLTDAVTIADNGIYLWLSIYTSPMIYTYIPSHFNNTYRNTLFAQETEWDVILNP